MKRLLLLPIIAVLASCATHLTQQQCVATDWRQEGAKDGAGGKPPRDLSRYVDDCAKFNLTVDRDAYRDGWRQGARQYCTPDYNVGYADGLAGRAKGDIYDRMPICLQANVKLDLSAYTNGRQQGLKSFCTYENGMNFARRGMLLPDVCPASLRAKFNSGWTAGKEDFCSRSENAFALGKENKPYPAMCPRDLYVAFRSEYDRGIAIGQRIGAAQGRLNELNGNISAEARRYWLENDGMGYYKIGTDNSPDALAARDRVNFMIREKQRVESDLFAMQVMK